MLLINLKTRPFLEEVLFFVNKRKKYNSNWQFIWFRNVKE